MKTSGFRCETKFGLLVFWDTLVLRLDLTEQEYVHWVQLKSFSPEWESMCVLELSAREVEYLHCAQLKAFSPE